MANSSSARKRIRQTLRRTARNSARRSRARRFVRFCEEALANYAASLSPSAKGTAKDAGKDKKTAKDSSNPKGESPPAPILLEEHVRRAMSELHRAAQKGAMHRKAVNRKVSRLAKRMKTLQQGGGETAASKTASSKASPKDATRA